MKKVITASLSMMSVMFILSCSSSSVREPYTGRKEIVAVPAFSDLTKSDVSSKVIASLSDKFATELIKTGRFEVVERARLKEVLNEHELTMAGVLTENDAVKLGRLAQAPYIIIGTINTMNITTSKLVDDAVIGYNRVNITITLNLRVISTTTGASVAAASITHNASKQVVRMGLDSETQFIKINDDMADSNSPIQEEISQAVSKLVDELYRQKF